MPVTVSPARSPEATGTQMLFHSEVCIFAVASVGASFSGFSLCSVLIKMKSVLGGGTNTLNNSYRAHGMLIFFSLAEFARATGKALDN